MYDDEWEQKLARGRDDGSSRTCAHTTTERKKGKEERVVVRREEKSFVLIENEFVLLILEKKGKLMMTMMNNKTYRHVDAFLAPLLRWRAILLLEQRWCRWCCGSRKHIFILLVMETIQLRIRNKRFFVVPKTFLSFFPGFFVSPIFWSFLVPVCLFNSTKTTNKKRTHLQKACKDLLRSELLQRLLLLLLRL